MTQFCWTCEVLCSRFHLSLCWCQRICVWILLRALESVSCLLPLVCLIVCLPSCLSIYPVILTHCSLFSCFPSYLPVSLLVCLSASFIWEVLLHGEERNGYHSNQLHKGEMGQTTGFMCSLLKFREWRFVSRGPIGSFHICEQVGEQLLGLSCTLSLWRWLKKKSSHWSFVCK